MRPPLADAKGYGILGKQMPLGLGRQHQPGIEPWPSAEEASPRATPQVPTLLSHAVACSYCRSL